MNVLLKVITLKVGVVAYIGLDHGDRFQIIDAHVGDTYELIRSVVDASLKRLANNLHEF
jgi:hypothetical protein